MIFQYFSDADMLYLKLSEKISTESAEVAPGVVLDFDEHNQMVGIEIEDASRLVDITRLELKSLPIVSLIFSDRTAQESAITRKAA
ncbi:MAG: DUF2283 domain-containing protein [Desulfococcaceae bacterium]